MDLQLKDKVVVVTGGAKVIGAAITKASVREGAIPVIVDRDQEACDKLFGELRLNHGRGLRVVADLQPAENCAQAVAETIRAFGRIDALINNAGVNDVIGMEPATTEKFAGS